MKLTLFAGKGGVVMKSGLLSCFLILSACSDGNSSKSVADSQSEQVEAANIVGNPEQGARLFGQCEACHSNKTGDPHLIGPNLVELIGSQSGSKEGFNYSSAMIDANLTWDADTLDKFLANPTLMIPGTRMMYPGITNAQQRADLVAYMSGDGKNQE